MPELAQAVRKSVATRENPSAHIQKKESFQSISPAFENIMFLQRNIGNQAVQRLIRTGGLQAKLRIGPPGDKYEKEADKVAQLVAASSTPPAIQFEGTQPLSIQRKTDRSSGASDAHTYDFIRKLNSGQPMKHSTRSRLESSMGVDLSNVKVHSDSTAHETASAMNARAFTYQNNIWLGRGESQDNIHLMAHEATHVVQQQDHSISKMPGGISSLNPSTIGHTEGAVLQRGTDSPEEKKEGFSGSVWSGLKNIGKAAGGFLEEQGLKLINSYAPEIVPIIKKGLVVWLEEKITSAVDNVFNTLMAPVRTVTGVVEAVTAHISSLQAWMQEAIVKILKGDCSSIFEAAEKIQMVIEGIASPIFDKVKTLAMKVGDFFTGLRDRFGVPIWDFLKQVGGWVWEKIQQLGALIWEKTAYIRKDAADVWNWIKKKLGIGEEPEGQDGILQWVKRKATDLWEKKIKPFIIRFKKPLIVVAGVLAMLSPAGPILAIGAGVYGLIRGIRWISQNMNKPKSVVEQQGILKEVIIPGLMGAVNSVKATLTKAAATVTGALGKVMGGLGEFIGAVGGSVLNFLVNAVQWIMNQFQGLVAWANEKVTSLVDAISSGLDILREFLQPLFEVLKKVADVVMDIMSLPSLVAGEIWKKIPACIRNPFVNFLINQILLKIPIFKQIIEVVPAIWGAIKETAMTVIRKVFKEGDLKGAALEVLKLVLRALNIPVELFKAVFAKAGDAINLVVQNPFGFLMNLLEAIKNGFFQFGEKILSHLASGLKNWIFSAVTDAGLHPPEDFSLKSVFNFILEVLDITVEKVLARLEIKIGKDKVEPIRRGIRIISHVWEWISTLLKEGPEGVWNKLTEKLKDLWGSLIDGISGWIVENVSKMAIKKLGTMLVGGPVGAVVQGFITIYNAIQSLVKYARQLLEIVDKVLDNIASIASGSISTAADKVESLLERALTVALGFLANQVGLGDLSEKIKDIVEVIRKKVVEGIDWLIDKAIAIGGALIGMVKGAAGKVMEWWKLKKKVMQGDKEHKLYFEGEEQSAKLTIESKPMGLRDYLNIEIKPKFSTHPKAGNIPLIETEIGKIEEIKKRTGGGFGKTAGGEISESLNKIADFLQELGDEVPETKVTQKPRNLPDGSVVGEEMEAKPLTLKPGPYKGSAPYDETITWNAVKRRVGKYIRGHLLNHHLFGAGKNDNLVPITGKLNTTMSSRVEEKVKEAVFGLKKIVRYHVKVEFGGYKGGPRKIKEEEYLPTAISLKAYEIEAQGNEWKDKEKIYDDRIEHILPDNNEPIDVKPRLKRLAINNPRSKGGEDPKKALLQLEGIGDVRADKLLDNKNRFSKWDDVETYLKQSDLVEQWKKQKNEVDGERLVYFDGETIWVY